MKCIEDEIPFEVPEGWEWCRLASIANIVTGSLDANAQCENGEFPFFTCGEEVLLTDSYAFDCDAVLLGGNNAVGDFKMHRYTGMFNAYQRVYVITGYDSMNIDYLYYHVQYYLKHLQKVSIGTQTRYLKLGMIQELLIAFPPSSEQERIYHKIDSLSKYIDNINKNKIELMDEVSVIKTKILDLAIQGKLIPQDGNDEPASVLLDRIRKEKENLIKQGKLKRDKKESFIYKGDDNSYYEQIGKEVTDISESIPFQIPDNWEWCRLKSLSALEENAFVDGPFGSNLKTEHYTANEEVRIVQLNNIGIFEWKDAGKKYTTYDHAQTISRCISKPGDLIIAKMMPAGRTIILPPVNDTFVISSDCVRLRSNSLIDKEYLLYMLNSPCINALVMENVQGIGRTRTSLNKMKELLVPVPPISMQTRIVAIIKQMFTQLQDIESSIA